MFRRGEAGGGAVPMQSTLPSTRLALIYRAWIGIDSRGSLIVYSWLAHGEVMERSLISIDGRGGRMARWIV